MAIYNPEMTLAEARALFFARNDFGADGGYEDRWVKVKVGRLPIWFPNTQGRRLAVRFHDLHHILNEYETTWQGETEIGAWEVATGLGRHYAGWLLDLLGFAVGLVINPRHVYRAFMRGRRSSNLFFMDWDERILTRRVGDVRRQLRLSNAAAVDASLRDKASFALWSLAAICTYLLTAALLLGPAVALIWLSLRWL